MSDNTNLIKMAEWLPKDVVDKMTSALNGTLDADAAHQQREQQAVFDARMTVLKSLDACGIPRRHQPKIMQPRATSAVSVCADWAKSGKWLLVIAGKSGSGKSFAAAHAVYSMLLQRRIEGYAITCRMWVPAADLADMNRDEVKEIRSVPMLVIDDLGTEYAADSGWWIARIYSVLSHRFDNLMPTIITTNLTGKEISTRYQDQRLIRRLNGQDEGRDTQYVEVDK